MYTPSGHAALGRYRHIAYTVIIITGIIIVGVGISYLVVSEYIINGVYTVSLFADRESTRFNPRH